MKSIWNGIRGLRCVFVFLFPVTLSNAANNWKPLNHEIGHEKIKYTLEMPTTKNFRPTHKIPTRKIFGPTKYPREKVLDPRNTHEKKFRAHYILTRPTMTRDPLNLAHSISHPSEKPNCLLIKRFKSWGNNNRNEKGFISGSVVSKIF